jgi:predicted nucleic-acid-binding Zn-ribbon protein
MQNETCPKCGKHEMLTVLPLHDGSNMRPFVAIRETHPEDPREPKVAQTEFTAYTCGACGSTESTLSTTRN